MLLNMVVVLLGWDCKMLLVDVVYVVFVVDMMKVVDSEVMGVFVWCLNIEIFGYCLFVVKMVCVMLLKGDNDVVLMFV